MINTGENRFETAEIEYWLEDGILHGVFKEGVRLTLANSKLLVKARLDFCKGKSYPLFTDISNLKSIDKASRSYMSKE